MPESSELEAGQIDQLLGIANRGRLTADLLSLAAEPHGDRSLTLLWIDLDQFKQINDLYSHQVGDEVLQGVASAIKAVCENKGQAYRYGGDEIIVLFPGHSIREAVSVAEQIRERIVQTKFARYPETVTASIGLASYPESGCKFDELLSKADAAMYAVKDLGGNAIRVAGRESPEGSTILDGNVHIIRSDVASRVEAIELWMSLQQANYGNYTILLESDNDEDVIVEGLTLRKGTLYLCRFAKPKQPGEWVVPAHSRKQISGEFPSDPSATLVTKDPSLASGVAIEIDIVARARVLGRLRNLSHTILATANYGNHLIIQFSP
jgi:diguanylate cyclase (GGDEF)-like protein